MRSLGCAASLLIVAIIVAAVLAMLADRADAHDCYAAQVTRVIDGDSLRADVAIYRSLTASESVRINGIDTPEKRGKCDAEKQLAARATEHVEQWAASGAVLLCNVGSDKYGRLLADVISIETGESLADSLIAADLAVAYDGGTKNKDWCAGESVNE